jgi:hypothetical protein
VAAALGDDTQLFLLAAYLAAVVHDVEHRGLNNDFLAKTGDELAVTYNGKNVAVPGTLGFLMQTETAGAKTCSVSCDVQ